MYPNVFKVIQRTAEFPTMPAPFVIHAPEFGKRQWQAGESLIFSILLFGTAVRRSAEVLRAASVVFESRFAQTQGALVLRSVRDGFTGQSAEKDLQIAVWSDEGAQSIPPAQGIKIRFLSPTQIYHDRFVADKPDFPLFIDSLLARIAAMIDVYGENEFTLPYGLHRRKPQVTMQFSTQRITIPQDHGQRVDGVIGEVLYEGGITRYLPYLDLGTQLHVGKKTTRGCGQYEMEIF
ncbi:MAG: CRISPR system precrRNA processing endoribonuclease RAMP protein Cas6 [Oscillospiraceae bacterium]|nr:CRISPR system precrRNA processing endoribonuclease RAMP protein Cas6 [Oscillospiraceae bacterium]